MPSCSFACIAVYAATHPHTMNATVINHSVKIAIDNLATRVPEKRQKNLGAGVWPRAHSFFSISPRFHLMACSSTS